MKTIVRLKTILLLVMLGVSLLSQAQKITFAEYYIDTDPGFGNGTPINIGVNSDSISVNFNVSLVGLANGDHKMVVRLRDSLGAWGIPEVRQFKVYTPDTATSYKIVGAEYYVDSDPGIGNGAAISTGIPADSILTNTNLNIGSLSPGLHTMFVRTKYNDGRWSINEGRSFMVIKDDQVNSSRIKYAEYYIDTDPGFGKATPVTYIFPVDSLSANFSADLTGLSNGAHVIVVRTLDSAGIWSISEGRYFNIINDEQPSAPIKSLEYFADTDPGLGLANRIDTIATADSVSVSLTISLSGMPAGDHSFNARAQDSIGQYSFNNAKTVHICDVLPQADFDVDSNCVYNTIHFTNLTTDGDNNTQYYWDVTNDGYNDYTTINASTYFYYAGTYTARLIATNGGYCADTAYHTFRISSQVYANIDVTGVTTFCDGNSVKLSSASNYPNYLWSDNSTSNSITVTTSGDYSLIVRDGGCIDTSTTVKVTVKPVPSTPVAFNNNTSISSSEAVGNQWYELTKGKLTGETGQVLIPTESGKYYTIATLNGCSSPSSDTIDFAYDPQNCYTEFSYIVDQDNKTISLTNMSANSTNVNWTLGDGTQLFTDNPVYQYKAAGKYNVCLSSLNSVTGCLKRICKDILIGDIYCTAEFSAATSDTSLTVDFTDLSLNTTEWNWDLGDGNQAKTKNVSHTYPSKGLYQVCHLVKNTTTGCLDHHCMTIKVGLEDTVATNANFAYIVANNTNTVTFSDKSSQNVTSWYWTFGDGNYSTDPNTTYTFSKAGIYKTCLKVFDSNTGTSDEHCEDIIVGNTSCAISASFETFIKETNEVSFVNQSIGDADLYYWNFGDGTTSTTKNPVHYFASSGYYLISLAIKNSANQCTDYYSQFLKVGETNCTASFDYQVNVGTKEVAFTNKSEGNLTKYFWYFGDGNYSIDKDPVYTYPEDGLYRVSLTVSDANSTCVDNYYTTIQVGQVSCDATFSYFVDSSTNTVYFKNKDIGSSTNLLWIFGDGTMSSKTNPSHQFVRSGYFTVSLNTFNADNGWCMDYYESKILIGKQGSSCVSDFIYQSNSNDNTVKFYDASIGDIAGYVWNYGDGVIESAKDPSHTYNVSGYYNVCHLVVNTDLVSNITCKPVVVAPGNAVTCRADFYYSVDSLNKKAIVTDASDGNPDNWLWSSGDGRTVTLSKATISYSKSGYYMVGLKIRNSQNNCIAKTYKLINIGEAQGIKAGFGYDVDTTQQKAGDYPVDFVGAGIGDHSRLRWDFGDGNTDSTTTTPTHVYTEPGTYKVCYEVSDPLTGIKDSVCDNITIKGSTNIKTVTVSENTLSAYPNPFSEYVNVSYVLKENTLVDVSIYNSEGKKIETYVRAVKAKGEQKLTLNTANLSKGIYVINLVTDKGQKEYKAIMKR